MNRRKVTALVLLALGMAFFLLFTIGEIAGGDLAGLQHLPPALILGALLLVAWRRPHLAGAVLLGLTLPLAVLVVLLFLVRDAPLAAALILVLPTAATGALLLRA